MKLARVIPLNSSMVLLGLLLWLLAGATAGVPTAYAGDELQVPQDFSTIQAAVDAAGTGDTIEVDKGIFSENVVIAGKTNIRLRGDDTVLQGSAVGIGINIVNSDHIRVEGFIVDGFHTGIVLEGTHHSRIHDVETRNNVNPTHTRSEAVANHDGLQLIGSSDNLISYVFAHDNGHNGVSLKGGSSNNTLEEITTNDNGKHPSMEDNPAGCGIQLFRDSNDNNVLTKNESLRNAFGILLSGKNAANPDAGSTGNLIEGNEVHQNGRAGIDVRNGSSGNFIIDNDATGNAFLDNRTFDLHDQGVFDNIWKDNEGNANFVIPDDD